MSRIAEATALRRPARPTGAGRHTEGTSTATSAGRRSDLRADIQGLRAVSVLAVIADHLFGWPRGGFVGVDVFFVISGFLITGLLLKRADTRDRVVSVGGFFADFYRRRARRILPAALVALAGTWVAAHLVFAAVRVREVSVDLLWALGFSANIHFARIGTDYFQRTRPASPVQHFWSLAVEEQFYLVWPVVILAVTLLVGRRAGRPAARRALLGAVLVGTAASFAYGVHLTAVAPAAAYFSSPARAWELGVGAVLSVLAWQRPRGELAGKVWRERLAGPLSLLGLAGIVASLFLVRPDSGFPAPAAALPVASAALVLAAGRQGPLGGWQWPLTNPVAQYVGLISYSLYLWHWPVIVVGQALVRDRGTFYAVSLLVTAGLSVLSYHLVEAPMRSGLVRRWRPTRGWRSTAVPVVGAVSCLGAAVALYGIQPPAPAPVFHAAAPVQVARSDVAQPTPELAGGITAALAATAWPALTPPASQLSFDSAAASWKQCPGGDETTCSFGDPAATKTAVVIGDSIAMAYLPTFSAAMVPMGYRLAGLTLGDCPAALVSVHTGETPPRHFDACDSRHQFVVARLAALRPQVVLIADNHGTLERLQSGATGQAAADEYRAGLERLIDTIRQTFDPRIVVVSPPPIIPAIGSCKTAVSVPGDCVGSINTVWRLVAAAQRDVATSRHVSYINTVLLFCNADGFCPQFVNGLAVKFDGIHMTDVYARSIAPEFGTALHSIAGIS